MSLGAFPGLFPAVSAQPEVLVGGVSVVAAAAQLDYTNAVRVTAPATDRAEVRVGYGLNLDVTLGTETTVAGAGNHASFVAGNAVGAGPSNGGNCFVTAGAGIGGGAGGGVQIDGGGSDSGAGGIVSLFGGNSITGIGGDIAIVAGQGGGGLGGATSVQAGQGTTGGGQLLLAGGSRTAGVGVGANVVIRPGQGFGGGAQGSIVLDDQGAALSVLPFTTNQVTVGSASLALASVRTRIVQADAGANISVHYSGGAAGITITSGGSINLNLDTSSASDIVIQDNFEGAYGSSRDFNLQWTTANANNAMVFSTGVNSAAQSGNIIVTTNANLDNEHGLAAVATPRLSIFSAADMSVAGNRTQYIQMYHDGTVGRVYHGTGNSEIRLASQVYQWASSGGSTRLVITATLSGPTFVEWTQPANTSGSPTGLLWTAGAHTGLDIAETIDQRWLNNRTVTFGAAGGASFALQRSVVIGAPTYARTTNPLTIDEAATVEISNAPQEGTNVTITTAWALRIPAGNVRIAAVLNIGAAPTFDYALAAADINVPILLNTPTGVGAVQKGWRRINGASGAEEYVPVWGA